MAFSNDKLNNMDIIIYDYKTRSLLIIKSEIINEKFKLITFGIFLFLSYMKKIKDYNLNNIHLK